MIDEKTGIEQGKFMLDEKCAEHRSLCGTREESACCRVGLGTLLMSQGLGNTLSIARIVALSRREFMWLYVTGISAVALTGEVH